MTELKLFADEMERTAIGRIRKFAKIADAMGFDVALGFSGGKDSVVTYDLCKRSGIAFKAYFNMSFESQTTLKFIREHYPDVIFRRDHKFGFIENISRNHAGLLPTVEKAYCCEDYKHNGKYVDKASIVGVRAHESRSRANRTVLSVRNKTTLKCSKELLNGYFREECQGTGTASVIQLLPILEWTDDDVWGYTYKHSLPVNPEYRHSKRVGCMVCPKANFSSNCRTLLKYPKLIDAFAKAKEANPNLDWLITFEGIDCANDKCYYICRWLNHSFRPFSKRNWEEYMKVKEAYEKMKSK